MNLGPDASGPYCGPVVTSSGCLCKQVMTRYFPQPVSSRSITSQAGSTIVLPCNDVSTVQPVLSIIVAFPVCLSCRHLNRLCRIGAWPCQFQYVSTGLWNVNLRGLCAVSLTFFVGEKSLSVNLLLAVGNVFLSTVKYCVMGHCLQNDLQLFLPLSLRFRRHGLPAVTLLQRFQRMV